MRVENVMFLNFGIYIQSLYLIFFTLMLDLLIAKGTLGVSLYV